MPYCWLLPKKLFFSNVCCSALSVKACPFRQIHYFNKSKNNQHIGLRQFWCSSSEPPTKYKTFYCFSIFFIGAGRLKNFFQFLLLLPQAMSKSSVSKIYCSSKEGHSPWRREGGQKAIEPPKEFPSLVCLLGSHFLIYTFCFASMLLLSL